MNMRDISRKTRTLRTARATARLATDAPTIARLRKGDLPKGDPLPIARVAAIQAAKNTSQMIPYCHPLPIEYVGVDFTIDDTGIDIAVEVKAIHRTGVEMEALTAASIAALSIYDILKAIDPAVMTIENVMLASKTGGKSRLKAPSGITIRAGILVVSDSVAAGEKEDAVGALIRERLEPYGVIVAQVEIVPDDPTRIAALVTQWCDRGDIDLIVGTGGTGLGPRDVTPEAIAPLLGRRLPGVEEAMRGHGQERTPYAMLSRGLAGQRGNTVVIALPGSPKGVEESLDAVMPALLHAVPVMRGGDHGGKGYGTTGDHEPAAV